MANYRSSRLYRPRFYYGSQSAFLSYHLAAGDSFQYIVNADIVGSRDVTPDIYFSTHFSGTVDVAGDGTIDFSAPLTYLTDLRTLKFRNVSSFQEDFGIQVILTRGGPSADATTLAFDPGVSATATAVPGPPSLVATLAGLASVRLLRGAARQRRARRAPG